jgi:hypothetical protein
VSSDLKLNIVLTLYISLFVQSILFSMFVSKV